MNWTKGDIAWNAAPTAGNPPGWVCVSRSNATMAVEAPAGVNSINVNSTENMMAGDPIYIALDNGGQHNTYIDSVVDSDTLLIHEAIPAGHIALVNAEVRTFRFRAMSNLESN
ncbi:MAG: hypothetical protein AB9866_18500 [Syntrophobacteraceae bacterium]